MDCNVIHSAPPPTDDGHLAINMMDTINTGETISGQSGAGLSISNFRLLFFLWRCYPCPIHATTI